MKTKSIPDNYICAADVAAAFGVKARTIISWSKKDIIPSYRKGRRFYYIWADIKTAMDSHRYLGRKKCPLLTETGGVIEGATDFVGPMFSSDGNVLICPAASRISSYDYAVDGPGEVITVSSKHNIFIIRGQRLRPVCDLLRRRFLQEISPSCVFDPEKPFISSVEIIELPRLDNN